MSWARATLDRRCGRCGGVIHRGEPIQTLEFARVSRTIVRCQACASEPVPQLPDVPQRVIPAEPMKPLVMHRFDANSLPLDFKRAAAGREPGED